MKKEFNSKNRFNLTGVSVFYTPINKIIEQIYNHKKMSGTLFIVSLNPEIIVALNNDLSKKNAFENADYQIIDGVGIYLAGKLKGMQIDRCSGVDFLYHCLEVANQKKQKVLFIGGKGDLSKQVVKKVSSLYPSLQALGIEGFSNISKFSSEEENNIWETVSSFGPDIVFVSFGSTFQEEWIYQNLDKFGGAVVSGVGGAFSIIAGEVRRAPKVLRFFGLEWLWRLFQEPYRWRRQLKLFTFMKLVAIDVFGRQKRIE